MKHELWKDKGGQEYTFCREGPEGDGARGLLSKDAKLIWTCEAASHFEAMTKYYEYMGYGEYASDFAEDKIPYAELAKRENDDKK